MNRRRWLLLAGAAFAAWVLAAGLLLARTATELRAGRRAAAEARSGLDAASAVSGAPAHDLRVAAGHFDAGRSSARNPVLLPLRYAPVIGRQLRSADSLARAAGTVADAGADALERAAEVLDEHTGGGPARVDQVRALAEVLATASRRVDRPVGLGPRRGLVGPLAHARNDLAGDLAEARQTLRDASTTASVAADLLAGPRRYLLVAANNAEMRAGSGTWLTGGVLQAAAGRLTLGPMSPLNLDAPVPDDVAATGAVHLTGALASQWAWMHPEREWRSLMASPTLPTSAQAAVEMWRAAGKGEVDGVLVVDPVALRALVLATGPVQVGDRRIAAEQVVPELLHDQYLRFGDLDAGANGDRREVLGQLARAAFDALDAGRFSTTTLLQSLGEAVRGRHLLAWSKGGSEQRGWEAAGIDGQLAPDSLLVSILNRGGNKLDWFLRTGAHLTTRSVGGNTEVAVALTLRNATPSAQPSYVEGPHPDLDTVAGEYRGVLAVNVPGAATTLRFDGATTLVASGADGPTKVIALAVDLRRGETREVTLRFRLPGRHGRLVVEPSGRVPTTSWGYRERAATWEDFARYVAKW